VSRGGRRTGRTGTAYANRKDLNPVHKLPVTTAPGQGYGQATAQQQSQAAVPMASGELTDGQAPDFTSALASAQAAPVPNVITADVPSQNPAEPVNSAAPPPPITAVDPLVSGVALLNSLQTSSPEVKAIRDQVAQMAQQAATAP
jgi:hypothetical protein